MFLALEGGYLLFIYVLTIYTFVYLKHFQEEHVMGCRVSIEIAGASLVPQELQEQTPRTVGLVCPCRGDKQGQVWVGDRMGQHRRERDVFSDFGPAFRAQQRLAPRGNWIVNRADLSCRPAGKSVCWLAVTAGPRVGVPEPLCSSPSPKCLSS